MKRILKSILFVLFSVIIAYYATETTFRADILFYSLFFIAFIETLFKYINSEFKFFFTIAYLVMCFSLAYSLGCYITASILVTVFYFFDNKCYRAIKSVFALLKTYKVERRKEILNARIKARKRKRMLEKKHSEKSVDLMSVYGGDTDYV